MTVPHAPRRTGGDLRRLVPRLWHRLLQWSRPVFWVLLRLVPPRRHAVIHGWPTFEGNVVELLPRLARRYGHPIYWLVDGDPGAAEKHVRRFDLKGVQVIPKTSPQAIVRATTAEVTFFTHGLFTAVKPPANRLVVNLWHGDGPKTTTHAKDVASTVAVSGARMWKGYKARTFGLRDDDVACTGNPRTDALTRGLTPEQHERLGLDPGGALVLWLPTYRLGRNAGGLLWENGSLLSARSTLFDLGSAAAGAGLTLIVKPHPMDRDDYSRLGVRVLTDADLVAADVGLYELLGSCHALISDTSSAWVDYLAMDRPVGFLIPDADELARMRGFNVPDLFEILPGPLLRDADDVARFLTDVVRAPTDPRLTRPEERARIGTAPLGNASERLLDWLDEYQRARSRPSLFGIPRGTPTESDRGPTVLARPRTSGNQQGMRAVISCAFDENAIRAISRYASTSGRLVERLVPHWGLTGEAATQLAKLLSGSDGLARFAARTQAKLADARLPEDIAVSRLTELIRIAGARTSSPVTPFLGHYAWKAQFDHRASRALTSDDADVLIGMPGSCRQTFLTHGGPLKVFHAIDTHPRARNTALSEAYGSRARAEAYPAALVRRIEEELRLADVVLAPSRFVADGMVRHGVAPEKIELIPYGVDLTRFTVDESVPQPPTPRRPRLIFVGQISFRKGVPLLLDAVRGLDVDLTLVGQVFERSAVSRLPANVTLAGVLAPAELARAYNTHDAMVLPTVDDACSLVVAEAAATGLRVLTTDTNGAAELLPAGHLVIPSGNVDALRTAISELRPLGDEERREAASELRAGSETRIRSWGAYAEDVFQVLDAKVTSRRRAIAAVGS